MRKFFSNMTIRASLLWVLVFFSLMLVMGAVLGVLSLRVGDATMRDMRRSQALGNALQDMTSDYKKPLLDFARISYDKARADFKKYQDLPKPPGLEQEFKEIDGAYTALMGQGLKVMFDAVSVFRVNQRRVIDVPARELAAPVAAPRLAAQAA